MAGCLNCGESGNVSPENVKRWTEKLSNVLLSSTARNRFKSYLTDGEFKEGVSLVEFWEMCSTFMIKADEECQRTHGWRKNVESDSCSTKTGAADEGGQSAKLLLKEAEEIVQFADENIDFDAQMIRLKAAFRSEDIEQIVTVISEAKQRAAVMLEYNGYYRTFCEYLLKEKGLLRKGD